MATRNRRATSARVQVSGEDNLQVLAARMRALTEKRVAIGIRGDDELAVIAIVHEFGSAPKGIPERSFIRTGKIKSRATINKIVKAGVIEIAYGRKHPNQLYQEIGVAGLEKTAANFERIKQPPLSPIYASHKQGRKLLQAEEMRLKESLSWSIINRAHRGRRR
ncbi:hypothetical protein KIH86_03635 [Paenibacillus sp. HN-1]|uniref:hypothetical protein n=1 Tax=Paenibacillus TaxID=44249 RepID=UPI001CA916B0|nr:MULTISPECIES: hypothetical protein [Paenibacillus]MBY9077274.1 hypothetical protein [Paenibacillus sp. CGMCC 1.18879]MBY9083321.1 hypothetical protein [Paenibacillus sinensis]